MPGYCRISVYLGAVFGLRISEICALQRRDFDFRRGVLHVRHALGRGEGDVGALRLKDTKTESSNADMPIPTGFVPHASGAPSEVLYCAGEGEAMVISPDKSRIMQPNTLRDILD